LNNISLLYLFSDIVANPQTSFAIIANLILIESLLSIDNAAVLATMVMDLPTEERKKALKYGIWGAYIFRGLAMLFASFLIKIWFLKPLGGLYLLYLSIDFWIKRSKETTDANQEQHLKDKDNNWLYRLTVGWFGHFWATVCLVELMDMAFSIDNVFAAVAFTDNIILICAGVFIGILAMRFIAQWFVKIMEKLPFLEQAAYVVIGILGLKLFLSVLEYLYPNNVITDFLSSSSADMSVSLLTALVFIVPIGTSFLFNFPKRK
jgi:YkoY family integral membrane protein